MDVDLNSRSVEELLDLERDVRATLRLRDVDTPEAGPEIHEVIRIGLRRYRAKVGTVAPRAKRDTVLAEHRRCLLGISLGSEHSEGAMFDASVQWVAESFDECALVVGDSLHRHTLQVTTDAQNGSDRDLTPNEWRDRALAAGREFQLHGERIVAQYSDQCRFRWFPVSQITARGSYEDLLDGVPESLRNERGLPRPRGRVCRHLPGTCSRCRGRGHRRRREASARS